MVRWFARFTTLTIFTSFTIFTKFRIFTWVHNQFHFSITRRRNTCLQFECKTKSEKKIIIFLALHLTPPADPTQSIPPTYNIAPLWDGVLFIWKVFSSKLLSDKNIDWLQFFWLARQSLKLWANFRPGVPNERNCGFYFRCTSISSTYPGQTVRS